MPSELQVIDPSRDVRVGTFGNVVLVHFRLATPASAVGAFGAAVASIVRSGQRPLWLALIETTSAPPDEAARRAYSRFFEDQGEVLAGFVVVYEDEGFRAAMVRTIVSAVMSVLPRRRFAFPRHVVRSLDEAAALLVKLSPGLDTAALLRAFEALRAG